jgi:endonuclease/exonuclease/phosphatase family metal-dependent hydrolase
LALTLATYNIHSCIGADGRFDPDRTVRVLNEFDADIVALQEVEHHQHDNVDLLDYIAAGAGMNAIAGPTLVRNTVNYGNAVLTRIPIGTVGRVDLSLAEREPRGALDIVFRHQDVTLRVVATHLGLRPRERREQADRLVDLLNIGSADWTVLMGDLNEWFLWGRTLRTLRKHFRRTPNRLTYPARLPVFALDHIWVSPTVSLVALEAHVTRLSRVTSDHLPLKAVIADGTPLNKG